MITILRLALVLSLFLAAAPLRAEDEPNDVDWKKGAWGDLSQYIGTYKQDIILDDARVADVLKKQIGDDKMKLLRSTLQANAPIDFEDDCLLISGNPGGGGSQSAAFVAVCLYEGRVHTALKEEGRTTLYTALEKYEYLPVTMRLWVYSQSHPEAMRMPDGVQLMLVP